MSQHVNLNYIYIFTKDVLHFKKIKCHMVRNRFRMLCILWDETEIDIFGRLQFFFAEFFFDKLQNRP